MGCVSNTGRVLTANSPMGVGIIKPVSQMKTPEAQIELVCPDYLVLENVLQAIVYRAPPKQKG